VRKPPLHLKASLKLDLKNACNDPVSVACDAANKGNLNLYPVAIRNFDVERNTASAILDFHENSD
jgi:hypothetical protein